MLTFLSKNAVPLCDGLTRRDFLRAGALAAGSVGLSLADLARLKAAENAQRKDTNCIILFLVGGPSQLETWDPKPRAPANIRGPFQSIRTNVPGIAINEHFPLMAQMADRYSIVRTVHHRAAPIHETGHQLMQTGRLFRAGVEHPHYGAVVSYLRGCKTTGARAFAVVPGPIGNTGVSISHAQTAGYLGAEHEPFFPSEDRAEGSVPIEGVDPASISGALPLLDAVEDVQRTLETDGAMDRCDQSCEQALGQVFSPKAKRAFAVTGERDVLRERYGANRFGQSCLLARRLVEHGVGLVTVNMFDTVFGTLSWDCHADGGALGVRLDDYKESLCPMFDRAYTALLADLHQRGLLESTLVVAMGEFGRTPELNPRGGRDHWPGCWSIVFAGGGVRGGQIIGVSDAHAAEPKDRPVSPAEVAATIYRSLGIDPHTHLAVPDNRSVPLAEAEPIEELFTG
jgi:uncharacterized protein (DUF1501 family)